MCFGQLRTGSSTMSFLDVFVLVQIHLNHWKVPDLILWSNTKTEFVKAAKLFLTDNHALTCICHFKTYE